MSSSSEQAIPLIRRVNQRTVLAVVAGAAGPVTGTSLMAATGLTRATVHAVCNDLIRLGWVHELAPKREVGTNLGRPSRWFQFNERAGYVLGGDIGAHSTTLVLADLRGTTLASERVPTDIHQPLADQARQTQQAVRQVATTADVHVDDLLAVAMGFASRVDLSGNIASEDEYAQASYEARRRALAELTGLTVLVENDANLAALGERWRGAAQGVDNLAVLLAGERMGAGLIESGRLLHGGQGGAGEMAFLDWVEGVGNADGIALLARTWAADAIENHIETTLAEAHGTPPTVTAERVFDAATDGDPVAQGILGRLTTRLARIIAILGTAFNPDLVVIAGAVSTSAGALLAGINEQLPTLTATPPRAAVSTLGESIVSIGAVKHALDFVHDNALDIPLTQEQ
jgi:predicted NBD/HSP70 family sugar kinase